MYLSLFTLSLNAQEGTLDTLYFAFTSDTNGRLASCSCPGLPYEGLNKRRALIDSIRKKDGFYLFDTGNLLNPKYLLLNEAGDSIVTDMYKSLGYNLILPSGNELALDTDRLKEISRNIGTPFIVQNLRSKGEYPFQGYIKFTHNALKFAVIGLLSSRIKPQDYKIEDYREAYRSLLPSLNDCNFIILLSGLGKLENRWIALRQKAPLLILGSMDKKEDSISDSILTEERIASTYLYQAGEEGGEVVSIRLIWDRSEKKPVSIHAISKKAISDLEDDIVFKDRIRQYQKRVLSLIKLNVEKNEKKEEKGLTVYLFHRIDCPKCAATQGLLERTSGFDKDFHIRLLDISKEENVVMRDMLNKRYGVKKEIVPALFFGKEYIAGWESIQDLIPKRLYIAIKAFKKTPPVKPIRLELFFSPTCKECQELLVQYLIPWSRLEPIEIYYNDINIKEKYVRMIELEKSARKTGDIPEAVINDSLYIGKKEITNKLRSMFKDLVTLP